LKFFSDFPLFFVVDGCGLEDLPNCCLEQTLAPLFKVGICCFESVLKGVVFLVFFVLLELWVINQKAFQRLHLYLIGY
jgi:hypothetical protein